MPISSTEIQNLISGQMQNMVAMQQAQRQFSMSTTPQPLPPQALSGQYADPTAANVHQFGGQAATGIGNMAPAAMAGIGLAAMFGHAPAMLDPFTSAARYGIMAGQGGGMAAGIMTGAGIMGAYAGAGALANNLFFDPFRQGAQMQGSAAGFASQIFPEASAQSQAAVAQMHLRMAQSPINAFVGAPTIAQVQMLTMQGIQAGDINARGGMSQFMQQNRQVMQQSRLLSNAMNISVNDAYEASVSLRNIGVDDGAQVGTLHAMQYGKVAGMDMPAMMQAATMGSMGAHRSGISRQLGISSAIRQSSMFGYVAKKRIMDIDEGDVQSFNQAGNRFFSGQHGQQVLAAMMDESGELDMSAAKQIAAGSMSREEVQRRYQRVIGRSSTHDNFMAHGEELASGFLAQFGPQGVVKSAKRMNQGLLHGQTRLLQDLGLNSQQAGQLSMLGDQEGDYRSRMAADLDDEMRTGPVKQGILESMSKAYETITRPITDRMKKMGEGVSAGIAKWAGEVANNFTGELDHTTNDPAMFRSFNRQSALGNATAGWMGAGLNRAMSLRQQQGYGTLSGTKLHGVGSSFLPRMAFGQAEGMNGVDFMDASGFGLMPEDGNAGVTAVMGGLAFAGGTAIHGGGRLLNLAGKTAQGFLAQGHDGLLMAADGSALPGFMEGATSALDGSRGLGLTAGNFFRGAGNAMSGARASLSTGRMAAGAMRGGGLLMQGLGTVGRLAGRIAEPLAIAQAVHMLGQSTGVFTADSNATGDTRRMMQTMGNLGLLDGVMQERVLGMNFSSGPVRRHGPEEDQGVWGNTVSRLGTGGFSVLGRIAEGAWNGANSASQWAFGTADHSTHGFTAGADDISLGTIESGGISWEQHTTNTLTLREASKLVAPGAMENLRRAKSTWSAATTQRAMDMAGDPTRQRELIGLLGSKELAGSFLAEQNKLPQGKFTLGGTRESYEGAYNAAGFSSEMTAERASGMFANAAQYLDPKTGGITDAYRRSLLAQGMSSRDADRASGSKFMGAAGSYMFQQSTDEMTRYNANFEQRRSSFAGDFARAGSMSGLNLSAVSGMFANYSPEEGHSYATDAPGLRHKAYMDIMGKNPTGQQLDDLVSTLSTSSNPEEQQLAAQLGPMAQIRRDLHGTKASSATLARGRSRGHLVADLLGDESLAGNKGINDYLSGKDSGLNAKSRATVENKIRSMLGSQADNATIDQVRSEIFAGARKGGSESLLTKANETIRNFQASHAMPTTANPGGEVGKLEQTAKALNGTIDNLNRMLQTKSVVEGVTGVKQ